MTPCVELWAVFEKRTVPEKTTIHSPPSIIHQFSDRSCLTYLGTEGSFASASTKHATHTGFRVDPSNGFGFSYGLGRRFRRFGLFHCLRSSHPGQSRTSRHQHTARCHTNTASNKTRITPRSVIRPPPPRFRMTLHHRLTAVNCPQRAGTLPYAQVRKRRARHKIVAVSTRVVFGTAEAVRGTLNALGQKINTAYIERVNRTLRAHVPGLGRREERLAKMESAFRRRGVLVVGYYNLCLPHASLRELLPQPIPTKGNGSPKKWQPRTPAMAADLTDHVWSVTEFLLFRVPPWRQVGMAA